MFDDLSFSDIDFKEQTNSTTVSGNIEEGGKAF